MGSRFTDEERRAYLRGEVPMPPDPIVPPANGNIPVEIPDVTQDQPEPLDVQPVARPSRFTDEERRSYLFGTNEAVPAAEPVDTQPEQRASRFTDEERRAYLTAGRSEQPRQRAPISDRIEENTLADRMFRSRQESVDAEVRRLLEEATEFRGPEEVRAEAERNVGFESPYLEQAVYNTAPRYGGSQVSFGGRQTPPMEPAPPMDVRSAEPIGFMDQLGNAMSLQSRVGQTRANRANDVISRSLRRGNDMARLMTPEVYGQQEGVTRQQKTEYTGFRSAVRLYLEQNPNVEMDAAVAAVQAELAEIGPLAAGEMPDNRYYPSAVEGQRGPNDPWYQAFSKHIEEGRPMPRLSDVQKEYLNEALAAREAEFREEIYARIDEEIPDYEMGSIAEEEGEYEVEGGLTEEDLDYEIDYQRDQLQRQLESDYGLGPVPIWAQHDADEILSNQEAYADHGWMRKTYADGSSVESTPAWLLRSAIAPINASTHLVYQGMAATDFMIPGLTREEQLASDAERMAETPLYDQGHWTDTYLRNVATGGSLMTDLYGVYSHGPEEHRHWAPVAGAAGFGVELLMVPLDGGVSSLLKGGATGVRTGRAASKMGLGAGAAWRSGARHGTTRFLQDLGEQAPGLGFVGRRMGLNAGDPLISLSNQGADYLDRAVDASSFMKRNPAATPEDVLAHIGRTDEGRSSRLYGEVASQVRNNNPITFRMGSMTDDLTELRRGLDEIVDGGTGPIPRRDLVMSALGRTSKTSDDALRSLLRSKPGAVDDIMRPITWDAASELATKVLGDAGISRDLVMLTPKVVVTSRQHDEIIKILDNDESFDIFQKIIKNPAVEKEFQDLRIHQLRGDGKVGTYNTTFRSAYEITKDQARELVAYAAKLKDEGFLSNHAYMKIVEEIQPSMAVSMFGKKGMKVNPRVSQGKHISVDGTNTLIQAGTERAAVLSRRGIKRTAFEGLSESAVKKLDIPAAARNSFFSGGWRGVKKAFNSMFRRIPAGSTPRGVVRSGPVNSALNTYKSSLKHMADKMRLDINSLKASPEMRAAYGIPEGAEDYVYLHALLIGKPGQRSAKDMIKILDDVFRDAFQGGTVRLDIGDVLSLKNTAIPPVRLTPEGKQLIRELKESYASKLDNAAPDEVYDILADYLNQINRHLDVGDRVYLVDPRKAVSMINVENDLATVIASAYYKNSARSLADDVYKTLANSSDDLAGIDFVMNKVQRIVAETSNSGRIAGKEAEMRAVQSIVDEAFDSGRIVGPEADLVNAKFGARYRGSPSAPDVVDPAFGKTFQDALQARIARRTNTGKLDSMDGLVEDILGKGATVTDPETLAVVRRIADELDQVAETIVSNNGAVNAKFGAGYRPSMSPPIHGVPDVIDPGFAKGFQDALQARIVRRINTGNLSSMDGLVDDVLGKGVVVTDPETLAVVRRIADELDEVAETIVRNNGYGMEATVDNVIQSIDNLFTPASRTWRKAAEKEVRMVNKAAKESDTPSMMVSQRAKALAEPDTDVVKMIDVDDAGKNSLALERDIVRQHESVHGPFEPGKFAAQEESLVGAYDRYRNELNRLLLGADTKDIISTTLHASTQLNHIKKTLLKLHKTDPTAAYQLGSFIGKKLDQLQSWQYSAIMGLNPAFHVKNTMSAPFIIWSTLGGEAAAMSMKNYGRAAAVLSQGSRHQGKILGRAGLGRGGDTVVRSPTGQTWTAKELYEQAITSGAMRSQKSIILSPKVLEMMMDDATMVPNARRAMKGMIREGFGKTGRGFKKANDFLQAATEVEDQVWRMATIITELEKGSSMTTALNTGRLSLMDYNALSATEKAMTAKLTMFYAFNRLGAAVLAKTIVNNPKRLVNLFRTKQFIGLMNGYDPTSEAAFYENPDMLTKKIVTGWHDSGGDSGSYYSTFGDIPILETFKMFADIATAGGGLDIASEAVEQFGVKKLSPTVRTAVNAAMPEAWEPGPAFPYVVNYVDERDIQVMPDWFWNVIIGEMPEGRPLKEGQRGYDNQRWYLSDEAMERYIMWKNDWMPALGAASPLQSWTPFFQIAGLGNLQGSRYTLPEALGLTQNIGSFTPHQQRTKIMQDIINENREENRE